MNLERKLIFIVNPISGTNSKKKVEETIKIETQKQQLWFKIFPSVANGNYSFLFDFIKDEKITDVVIVGGDGTVSQVVEGLKHLPVQFGIIPCGSGNGLAFGAKISKNVKKALSVIYNNHAEIIDGFRVNKRFACMLSGLGFDAQVAHDFANKSTRGLLTYIKQSFNNFIQAKSYSFEIRVGKKSFNIDAYFISIANSNQFGNHFKIAPKASLSDGLLDIVIVTHQNKLAFAYHTFLQIAGLNTLKDAEKLLIKKGILYFQTDAIKIINKGGAPMHIDGEPVAAAAEITLQIEPHCFKLLMPPSK